MRYRNLVKEEEGYLLLESLLTLTILMVVLVFMSPLTVNWLSKHREAKCLVEESRELYEHSIILNNHRPKRQESEKYTVEMDKNRLRIKETGVEVVIYESTFEK